MNPSSKNFSQRHSDKNRYTHNIICYRSICISKRGEITQMTINREKAEKTTTTVQSYNGVLCKCKKRTWTAFHNVMCSDLQDKLYIKRGKIKYAHYDDIYLKNWKGL